MREKSVKKYRSWREDSVLRVLLSKSVESEARTKVPVLKRKVLNECLSVTEVRKGKEEKCGS